jgi:hypothetical protein
MTDQQDDANPGHVGPGLRHSRISLATVSLYDCAFALVDSWTGFLVPQYLSGLPNANSQALYSLTVEEFTMPENSAQLIHFTLPPGNLENEIWQQLIQLDE